MGTIQDVLNVMISQKGYLEKKNNNEKYLDNFTTNAGSQNFTKFWRDIKNWGLGNFQGSYWCAAFIFWCFVKAYGLELAKKLLLHAPYISCDALANKSKNIGQLYSTPEVGDIVLFYNGSRYNHTGSVLTVNKSSKTFTTIEGNTSGASGVVANGGGVVAGKTYSYANGKTKFHRPDWSLIGTEYDKENEIISSPISTSSKGLRVTASTLNIRKAPNGDTLKDVYRVGDFIKASAKSFVNGKPWLKTDKGWVSGEYVEGWIQEVDKKWWYVTAGYKFPVNEWKIINDKQYLFDSEGYIIENDWKWEKGKWYYLGSGGVMITLNWIQYKNDWFYFKADGVMATDCYVKSTNKKLYYWVNEDGVWEPEWNTNTLDKKKM